MSGTPLGLEIVDAIRQQTNVLSAYVHIMSTETDNQFLRVDKELNDLKTDFKEWMNKLENVSTTYIIINMFCGCTLEVTN